MTGQLTALWTEEQRDPGALQTLLQSESLFQTPADKEDEKQDKNLICICKLYTCIQNSMLLNQLKSTSESVQRWYGLHCPVLTLSFPPHCEIAAGQPSRHYQTHAAYKRHTKGEAKSVCERKKGGRDQGREFLHANL